MIPRAVVVALALTCAVMLIATAVFWALGTGTGGISGWGTPGIQVILELLPLSFAVVGTVVALRQPANRIGWVCLAIGLLLSLDPGSYGTYGRDTGSAPLPGADFAIWLGDWIWLPAIGSVGTFLLLLFPDGRLLSPRWRVVAWASAVVIVLAIVAEAFHPGMLPSAPGVANPYPVEATNYIPGRLPGGANVLLAPCFAASAASLVLRFRRATGRERLQVKWFAAAAALLALLFALAGVANLVAGLLDAGRPLGLRVLEDAVSASVVGLPLAIGIAVLRHDLYEIDVSSIARSSTARSPQPWRRPTWAACCCSSSCWRGSPEAPVSPSPHRPWPPLRCSDPHTPASRPASTAASTAAGTTPSRHCSSSRRGFATRSASAHSTPT